VVVMEYLLRMRLFAVMGFLVLAVSSSIFFLFQFWASIYDSLGPVL